MFITQANDYFSYMRTSVSGNAETEPAATDSIWIYVNNGSQCYLFLSNDETSPTADVSFYMKFNTQLADGTFAQKVIKFGSADDLEKNAIALVSFGEAIRGANVWVAAIVTSSTTAEPFDIFYKIT